MPEYLKYLKPSSVSTLYGSQSKSRSNAILIMPRALTVEQFYMASTRAEKNFILISNDMSIYNTLRTRENSRYSLLGIHLRENILNPFLKKLNKELDEISYNQINYIKNEEEKIKNSKKCTESNKLKLFSYSKNYSITFQHNQKIPDIGEKQKNLIEKIQKNNKNFLFYNDFPLPFSIKKKDLKNYNFNFIYENSYSNYYDIDDLIESFKFPLN